MDYIRKPDGSRIAGGSALPPAPQGFSKLSRNGGQQNGLLGLTQTLPRPPEPVRRIHSEGGRGPG